MRTAKRLFLLDPSTKPFYRASDVRRSIHPHAYLFTVTRCCDTFGLPGDTLSREPGACAWFYAPSWIRTSQNTPSRMFVNKGERRAGSQELRPCLLLVPLAATSAAT